MPGTLRDQFPPIYARLLGDVFDRLEIVESRSTCGSCVMCDKGEVAAVETEYFDAETKCCTYHPRLPNYLVGGALGDPTPELAEGARRLRATIASRRAVTPRGLMQPRKVRLQMAATKQWFGRVPALRCPYLDVEGGGKCTVWRHRETTCSTWFCKYDDGMPGWAFWRAIQSYMGAVEFALSSWALKSVDPTLNDNPDDVRPLGIDDLRETPITDADYGRLWGKWVGREEEYYLACHDRVRNMTRAEVAARLDDLPEGASMLDRIRDHYDRIATPLIPAHLLRNRKMDPRFVRDGVVVTTYNPFDSFKLDKDLYEVLGAIDGSRTLEENLATLKAEHGIELEADLITYLVKHGVLVTPEQADGLF